MHDAFLAAISRAATDLLGYYGIPVASATFGDEPRCTRSEQIAALIGFAGPVFTGTLVMRASRTLVARTAPVPIPEIGGNAALCDWLGELANQLLGRTKNMFLRYGVSFHITPPTFAAGRDLQVTGCEAAHTTWLEVATEHGWMVAMLQLRVAPDAAPPLDEPYIDIPEEGALTLF